MCIDCGGLNVPTGAQGAVGPTGPQGPAGNNGINYLHAFEILGNTDITAGYNFTSTVTADGDYILVFQGQTKGITDYLSAMSSVLIKNGVLQSGNTNYIQRDTFTAGISNYCTHTHTAKLTGVVAGDIIGYQITGEAFTGDAYSQNASLLILKQA